MSTLDIVETFQVASDPDRVFAYLADPRLVVVCLPGAELDEVVDERNFTGNIKVKVGPVTVAYKGKAELTVLDRAAHRMELTARGTEKAGSGSAKMVMTGHVEAAPEGGSTVRVEAHVDVVGRIVQLGRGMIKGVSDQLFQQFVACVRANVEAVPAEASPAPAAAAAAPAKPEDVSRWESEGGAPKPAEPPPGGPEVLESNPRAPELTGEQAVAAAGLRPAEPSVRDPNAPHSFSISMSYTNQPVRALPLALRAIWASIRRFFLRLFGGRAKRN